MVRLRPAAVLIGRAGIALQAVVGAAGPCSAVPDRSLPGVGWSARRGRRGYRQRIRTDGEGAQVDITEVILAQHGEQRRMFALLDDIDPTDTPTLAAVWARLAVLLEVHAR